MKTPTSKTTRDQAAEEQARAARRAKIKAREFPKPPMCERLGTEPATHFVYYRLGYGAGAATEPPEDRGGFYTTAELEARYAQKLKAKRHWMFVCDEAPEGQYDFAIARFFKSPAATPIWRKSRGLIRKISCG